MNSRTGTKRIGKEPKVTKMNKRQAVVDSHDLLGPKMTSNIQKEICMLYIYIHCYYVLIYINLNIILKDTHI